MSRFGLLALLLRLGSLPFGRRRGQRSAPLDPGQAAVAVALAALLVVGVVTLTSQRRVSMWPAGLVAREDGAWGEEDITVVEPDSESRSLGLTSVLRVRYPAGSASPTLHRRTGAPIGGSQRYLEFADGPADAARLRYLVRFPDGFDFVRGGKLPGLYGGTETSGGRIPDGSDGFSTRLMWRDGGSGEVYAYLPSSAEYGTSIGRGRWSFEPGRWYEIEQELHLNRPGQPDGHLVVRVDGSTVVEVRDLLLRTVADLRIEGAFFSTFFGGGDESWATPRDTHVDFGGLHAEHLS